MKRWLDQATEALRGVDPESLVRAVEVLARVRDAGGMIFTAGNGGSAATASHLALDLQKTAGARAMSLSDHPGLITAWGNDVAFDRVFAEPLDLLGHPEDAVVAISVSGTSPNVIALLKAARARGLASVGLLGRDGGTARALVDAAVVVPSDDYGWVESAHVAVHHALAYGLRESATGVARLRKIAGD